MNLSVELEDFETQQYCYPDINGSCVVQPYTNLAKTLLYMLLMPATGITITGNLVVVISIAHFKQLHTPTNILVMSLALTDMLLGVFVMPFSMVEWVEGCWYFGDAFCLQHSTFYWMMTATSNYHLIFIAIDRYQSICRPLHYPSTVTIPVAFIMAGVSWGVPVLYYHVIFYTKLNMIGVDEYVASVSCLGYCNSAFNVVWVTLDAIFTVVCPCSVMAVVYAKIFLVARQHVRKLRSMNQQIHMKPENNNRNSSRSERDIAKTLGFVVICFIICWFPFYCIDIINPFVNFTIPELLFQSFTWLGYFNSTFNPIIYSFFYPWFRKTLKLIVTFKIFSAHSSDTNILYSTNNSS